MQGVYHRKSYRHPWTLVGRTKGVAHAEELMRRYNQTKGAVGVFAYLESRDLPNTLRDLRVLHYRMLAPFRLAKSMSTSWKKMQIDARMRWVKVDPRQTKMF